jgi:spore maturation protein SpmB
MKKTKFITGLLVTVLLSLALALPAVAQVEPPAVVEELAPGGSMTLTKEVITPTLLPTADVVISMDLTGSMGGELTNLKTEIGSIITALSGASADLNWG